MINIKQKEQCSGCYACESICPKGCISMQRDIEGFSYPYVDENSCIKCGACIKSCPIITPMECVKSESDISAYGAYTKNKELCSKSTSGGIFSEIAMRVIERGGTVFGAAFNDDFSVSHQSVKTADGLIKFQGSKYVQSTIGNVYKETKELLNNGELVLFTGTPCQIGGLYSFLGRDYETLITQDIVCHGVPSPMVWKKYIEYQEHQNKSETSFVQFRNKDSGWKTYSVVFKFQNDNEYRRKHRNDLYMRGFLSNLYLRPSCYSCAFKTKIRQSDITLADFWGIENVIPSMDNNRGVSLVFINSQKGQTLFDEIKHNIIFQKTDIDEAIKYNPSAIKSSNRPKNRDKFISCVKKRGFKSVTKKYLGDGFINRLKRVMKRVLKKILK